MKRTRVDNLDDWVKDSTTPRVDGCIAAVMKRFPTDSGAYYVEVHQELAPLARELETELEARINDLTAENLALRKLLGPATIPAAGTGG